MMVAHCCCVVLLHDIIRFHRSLFSLASSDILAPIPTMSPVTWQRGRNMSQHAYPKKSPPWYPTRVMMFYHVLPCFTIGYHYNRLNYRHGSQAPDCLISPLDHRSVSIVMGCIPSSLDGGNFMEHPNQKGMTMNRVPQFSETSRWL